MIPPAFWCPTQIVSGDAGEGLKSALARRPWVLMTSPGWVGRGIVERLSPLNGQPVAIVDTISPNPKLSEIIALDARYPQDVAFVAVGGGSALDAAKGFAALAAIGHDAARFEAHLIDGAPLNIDVAALPQLIGMPTTSGTGSEVTQWATIWGDDGAKYSLSDPVLRPTHAVLDPALCLSMTPDVTLYSALDALSHAIEAVWNVRNSPITDMLAGQAIALIRTVLLQILRDPGNATLRSQMQAAAVLAGLAMGTTQTALAHSISYPLTARFQLPHGFACSFTLPEIARFNLQTDKSRLQPIAQALGVVAEDIPAHLEEWFIELDIGRHVGRWISLADIETLGADLITPARAGNNMRRADSAIAKDIVRVSLVRLGIA